MNRLSNVIIIMIGGIVGVVYFPLFTHPEIIGGDWPYYFPEFLNDFVLMPPLWSYWFGQGLGGINPLLGLYMFSSVLIVPFVQWLGLPWVLVYKIGWFGLFLIASAVSIRQLVRICIPDADRIFIALAILIYTTNTYILMIMSGGQMGVAIAYAITPAVLTAFVKFIQKHTFQSAVYLALALALHLMLDPRIAYIGVCAGSMYGLYAVLTQRWNRVRVLQTLLYGALGGVLTILLSAFWIVPFVAVGSSGVAQLGAELFSIDGARFFSFARFETALALLHPNWPDNVFGKTGFMKPEYLVLSVIVYAGLVFSSRNRTTYQSVLFFGLLSLCGVFLSKGVQDPFGDLYYWAFEHVPGFVMFRDPTKFYVLIVVSYALLIPYTLARTSIIKKYYPLIVAVLFVVFWTISIREAVFGQLSGIFVTRAVPAEYQAYQAFIASRSDYFRVLWVPRQSRFSPASHVHMNMESGTLFEATTPAQLRTVFEDGAIQEQLASYSVKYIAIPSDPLGELFISDRQYDQKKRQMWEDVLDEITWLKKIQDDEIDLYETKRYHDKMWLENQGVVAYEYLRPDRYRINAVSEVSTTLYVSEGYHPGWRLAYNDQIISPEETVYGTLAFPIPAGDVDALMYFAPQSYVRYGMIISVVTALGAGLFLSTTAVKKS